MKTAAMTGRSMPCPWVGKNTLISRVRRSPAKAAITPCMVKSRIRVASTLIPMTRATSALSPMNMMASPNLCRLRMNQRNTVSPSAQSAWAGKIPNRRPTKMVWIVVAVIASMSIWSPPAIRIVTPYQKNCAARVAMMEGTLSRATRRPLM